MIKTYITVEQGEEKIEKVYVARSYDEVINMIYKTLPNDVEEMVDVLKERADEKLEELRIESQRLSQPND